ncbi:hypothetical protein KIH39_17290 [Telmatocola sphagniphila]|uniref:Lipoprotein n=1 Tax=Telmatocola sphagniphila TaxID=1123043 RepID=A0A8E6B1Z3_9BACT|nr:hypothetical protein [Telmatocola sphagniphila]QVL30600.1 hypothetical protein KIH39_17290 [Telmatocola sphagniphila]
MKLVKAVALSTVLGLVSLSGVACEKAAEVAKKSEETVKHLTGEALQKAKEEYAKLTESHFGGIEEKIKGLSGKTKEEAQEMYTKLKEKLAKLKETAPEKFHEAKEEISKHLAELKTKVGG